MCGVVGRGEYTQMDGVEWSGVGWIGLDWIGWG